MTRRRNWIRSGFRGDSSPLRDLWPFLPSVSRFSLTVENSAGGASRISHRGSGHVRIESSVSATDSSIIWHEAGRWTAGPLAGISFRNTTAWRREGDRPGLHLSHLRRGVLSPTFLATLQPDPSGVWVAEEPHLCGPDCYYPALTWQPGRLSLRWDVRSPTDPYSLHFEGWREA